MNDTQVYEDAIAALMRANKAIRQNDLDCIASLRERVAYLEYTIDKLHEPVFDRVPAHD